MEYILILFFQNVGNTSTGCKKLFSVGVISYELVYCDDLQIV